MAASGKVVDLRNLLAERFPHPPASAQGRLITGLSFLDQTIGGGLPKGAITELISPQVSAGSASLIHALIQSASGTALPAVGLTGILSAVGRTRCGEPALVDSAGETPASPADSPRDESVRLADKMSVPRPVALIDGCDSFDPQPLGNAGLHHLLWVRCNKACEAIKAADLLLRDGNFPLVIVDLVLNPRAELRKIPQTSWYRLQRLVEPTSVACLVLIRQSMVGSAQLKIVLENLWTLETFEKDNATSRWQFRIQRSHLSRRESAIAGAS
jgi:hypothetical protein